MFSIDYFYGSSTLQTGRLVLIVQGSFFYSVSRVRQLVTGNDDRHQKQPQQRSALLGLGYRDTTRHVVSWLLCHQAAFTAGQHQRQRQRRQTSKTTSTTYWGLGAGIQLNSVLASLSASRVNSGSEVVGTTHEGSVYPACLITTTRRMQSAA